MSDEICFEDEVIKCIDTGNSDYVKIAMRETRPRKQQVEWALRRLIEHRITLGVIVLCSSNNRKSVEFAQVAFWDLVRNDDHEAAQWLYEVYGGKAYGDRIWYVLSKHRNIKFAQFLIDQGHTSISREYLVDVIEEGDYEFAGLALKNTTDQKEWRDRSSYLLHALFLLKNDGHLDFVNQMMFTCRGDQLMELMVSAMSYERISGVAGEYDFLFEAVSNHFTCKLTGVSRSDEEHEVNLRLHYLHKQVQNVTLVATARRL